MEVYICQTANETLLNITMPMSNCTIQRRYFWKHWRSLHKGNSPMLWLRFSLTPRPRTLLLFLSPTWTHAKQFNVYKTVVCESDREVRRRYRAITWEKCPKCYIILDFRDFDILERIGSWELSFRQYTTLVILARLRAPRLPFGELHYNFPERCGHTVSLRLYSNT